MGIAAREADGQTVQTVTDGDDVLGFVVVDSTVAGRARGGLRMTPDVGVEELSAAARAMTLKYGFLGLPQGGAKAGVRGDPDGPPEDRNAALARFAAVAAPLLADARYVPDADLGTTSDDVRRMMESVGIDRGPREWQGGRSGHFTAVSCLAGVLAGLTAHGRELAGTRVAIEGFGAVGSALAGLVAARGARVVAVSTSRGALHDPGGLDVDGLLAARARHGNAFVERADAAQRRDRADLLEVETDVLCPCARHFSLHEGNADSIRAELVCPGANDPATPEAERRLLLRGVLVLPDFITNSGGVLGGTLDYAAVAPDRVEGIVLEHVRSAVTALIAEAERRGSSTRAVAEADALVRHAAVRRQAESPGFVGRCVGAAMRAYRRGALPRALVAAVAPLYVRRLLRR